MTSLSQDSRAGQTVQDRQLNEHPTNNNCPVTVNGLIFLRFDTSAIGLLVSIQTQRTTSPPCNGYTIFIFLSESLCAEMCNHGRSVQRDTRTDTVSLPSAISYKGNGFLSSNEASRN